MDLMVMENLLFGRNITRLYDLKGSSRSRYNADSSGSNKVLLDQNLLEAMPTSPIFLGNKAKRLLERAVWNDTSFLQVSYFQYLKHLRYHVAILVRSILFVKNSLVMNSWGWCVVCAVD